LGIDRIANPARKGTRDFDFDELLTDRIPCQKVIHDEAAERLAKTLLICRNDGDMWDSQELCDISLGDGQMQIVDSIAVFD
jgi:hypothetical protein